MVINAPSIRKTGIVTPGSFHGAGNHFLPKKTTNAPKRAYPIKSTAMAIHMMSKGMTF